jgi:hypothetical protein
LRTLGAPRRRGVVIAPSCAWHLKSIKTSHADLVKGYPHIMPVFGDMIEDHDVTDIVVFIHSLK